MSSPTPALQKKRKKPEAKPQSQVNKCLNEKRRREQENTYIEELAELIQASIVSDMTSLSVKPDKCAILQQTVDEIKQIKEAEASEGAVQQGEVSSSRQTLLQNQLLGPLVLEALDGFLFLVSTEGKIEKVSENVSQYIRFAPEDLSGKVIYNIIHVGDHTKFSSSFMSVGWPSEASSECSRSRSFTCRLLVKPPDDQEETMEEKQQRVSQYEPLQISAVLSSNYLREKGESEDVCEGDNQQYLVCIARRIPNNEPQGTPVEQFTTKLNTHGDILDIDISGISSPYSQYLTKDLARKNLGDFCHPADYKKFTSLLRETLHSGHSTSQIYRLKFASDCFIHIQSKCKYFHNPHEESFIMATHSVLSSFQEGGTSSNSIATPTAGVGNILEESLVSAMSQGSNQESSTTAADNSRQLRLLLTQVSEGTNLGGGAENELTRAETQQQNKILKGLLDQKDEEDASSPNSLLSRLCPPGHLQQQPTSQSQNHLMNHLQESLGKGNSPGNNMLRELLNDKSEDEDKLRIKKEKDPFLYEILQEDAKEEKVTVKQEFRSSLSGPSSCPSSSNLATTSGPVGMSPSSSPSALSSVASFTTPSYAFSSSASSTPRPPSRPSSTDLQGNMLRGIKRPSDEAHDGNPSKQTVGGFESLLDGSPPTAVMSPVSGTGLLGGPATPHGRPNTPHGRPNTPHGRPNTPHGRPNTPHGRPNTPHGRPNTPHSGPLTPHPPGTPLGGPPTPHGPPTPLGVGSIHIGTPNPQGMTSPCTMGNLSLGPSNVTITMNQNMTTSAVTQQQMQHQQQQPLQQQQQIQLQQQQQNSKHEKNKMLLQLLQTKTEEPSSSSTCLKPLTASPFALPQEKLPKDINEKLHQIQGFRTWTTSSSTTNTSSVASSSANSKTEILNHLLRQPNNTRPHKVVAGLHRQASQPGQDTLAAQNDMQQHQQQQQLLHMQQQQQHTLPSHLQSVSQLQCANSQNNLGLPSNTLSNHTSITGNVSIGGVANQIGVMNTGMDNTNSVGMNTLTSGMNTLTSAGMNTLTSSRMNTFTSSGMNAGMTSTGMNALTSAGMNTLISTGMNTLTSVGMSTLTSTGLNTLTSTGMNTLSPVNSLPSTTNSTTTLPPFSHSMGVNIFGSVSSTSYPEGSLPSITTATSSFNQDPLNNDMHYMHDNAMQFLLDLEMSSSGESTGLHSLLDDISLTSSSSSQFDLNENFAIQQIKKKLMSEEFETQTSPTNLCGPMSLPSFSGAAGSPVSSMGNYPPPYTQRNRYPSSGPTVVSGTNSLVGNSTMGNVGSNPVMRQTVPQFSPGSPVMQSRPLPGQQLTPQQQEQMKARLLQRQQHQVLLPSSSSDATQASSPYQNFDELINSSVAPNVNVALQRNPSDPQSSPNYGMMSSPIGSGGGGQVSPGQRIPQPPFSPHGQIASPLSNTQYTNNTGMNQMGSYQNQNSQLSPRLSQGSPAPPNYQTGGALLPQVSPTGHNPVVQVPQGQQSPAWSGSSPQHRSSMQQQNPMLNNQLGQMIGGGNRTFPGGGGRTTQLPSIRSLPNTVPRQAPYSIGGPQSSGSPDLNAYSTSSPQQGPPSLIFQQQQQQQQFRLARTISAPGQMPGVHSGRSAHFHPLHPGAHHHHPHNAPSQVMGGQFSPHPAPSNMPSPHMGPLGAMESVPPMMSMGNQHVMGGMVGGMMGQGYVGDVPGGVHPHSFDGGSPNCYGTTEGTRNAPGASGMINDRTRKELRARFEARNTAVSGVGGAASPSLAQQHHQQQLQQSQLQQQQQSQLQQQQQSQQLQQQQQPQQGPQQRSPMTQQQQPQQGGVRQQQQQIPQQTQPQSGAQQSGGFSPLDHHHPHPHPNHPLDQPLLHSYSPSGDDGNWSREGFSAGHPQGGAGAMKPSPRVEETRRETGGEKENSMLQRLLSQ